MSSLIGRAFLFGLPFVIGCSDPAPPLPPRAELLGASSDRILAIASGGDAIFVAREGSLERVERDGSLVRVAGAEYRTCPTDGSASWSPDDEDSFGGTSIVIEGGTATFFAPKCGVWTRGIADGSTRVLLTPAADWISTMGTVAVAGNEILACFTVGGPRGLGVELWSAARDGASSPRRLAELRDGQTETCRALVADGPRAVVLVAGAPDEKEWVLGIDRAAAGPPVKIMVGDRFTGLAVDGDAFFAIRDGAIVRVDKRDGVERELVSSVKGHLVDRRLTVAGGFLYWFGGHGTEHTFAKTVERVAVTGGARETVYENPDEPNGIWPARALVVRDDGTYFAWWELMPANEPETFAVARVVR